MDNKPKQETVSKEILNQVDYIASQVESVGYSEFVHVQNFDFILSKFSKPLDGFDPEFLACLVYKCSRRHRNL